MNFNNTWTNSILRLIATIINYKNNIISRQDINLLIIIYIKNNCFISLNNWDNPKYFISLFSTFFKFTIKSHFITNKRLKKIKMFIDA